MHPDAAVTTAYRCASTAPSSIITSPGEARTSAVCLGHRREHAPGNTGEQLDSVQGGHSLDEAERGDRGIDAASVIALDFRGQSPT